MNVPWDRLFQAETSHGFSVPPACQPEYCCGHELGHPFETLCLADNQNQEEWKEGLCDFTRLLLLRLWAMRHPAFEAIHDQYERYISTIDPTGKDDRSNERRYHYAARLILNWLRDKGREASPAHFKELFDGDMTAALGTWRSRPSS